MIAAQHRCSSEQSPAMVLCAGILSTLVMCYSSSTEAFQFQSGELTGSFDSTLSAGVSWRVEPRDTSLIGIANGGSAFSVNGDDGNLNYDEGVVSSAFKGTHDLELNYHNAGAFVRANYFYDYENQRGTRERTPLKDESLGLVGKDFRFLDAYVRARFFPTERPLEVRVGKQVLNWGEGTFFLNSINTINPIDVSKLRLPGAELREALLPVNLAWGNLSITENFSIEAYYQIEWDNTNIDPPGTYFSSNDFAGIGGDTVWVGFGALPDSTPGGVGIPRSTDRDADDDGQYGLAAHWLVPEIGTEFGLYYLKYHSRLPLTSGSVVTGASVTTARYFLEYPEDIELYGVSFNTNLGNTGIALQGEYSFRKDMPLQVHANEIILSATCNPLSQLGACPNGPGSDVPGFKPLDVSQAQVTATKVFGPAFGSNQWILLGEVGATKVHDMPSKSELRFDGPGTPLPGNAMVAALSGVPQQIDGFADDFSWGYRVVTSLTYNNAIGPISLTPLIAFAHDVNGTSPGPGGNFVEDRKALTIGMQANYLNRWTVDIKYSQFYGAGNFNVIHDRDFVSLVVKYAF